jgi:hypothetical protein
MAEKSRFLFDTGWGGAGEAETKLLSNTETT